MLIHANNIILILIHRCSVFPGCCHKHWKRARWSKSFLVKVPLLVRNSPQQNFLEKLRLVTEMLNFNNNPSLLKITKIRSICFSTQSSNTFLSSYGPVGMLLTLS